MLNAEQVVEKESYWIIKQALPVAMCDLISEYVRLKARLRPQRGKSTPVLKEVHREYADPLMETLLAQLTPLVEQVLACAVWPTLSFCYAYARGNQLLPHVDRSSCQWVVGLCLGADEAFKQQHGVWPLYLTVQGQPEAVHLDYGDLVIFKGHTTKHWREAFCGEWFVSAIFAFVEQHGPFAFQKFDQRRALGKPHVGMFRWTFGCWINQLKSRFKHQWR